MEGTILQNQVFRGDISHYGMGLEQEDTTGLSLSCLDTYRLAWSRKRDTL